MLKFIVSDTSVKWDTGAIITHFLFRWIVFQGVFKAGG